MFKHSYAVIVLFIISFFPNPTKAERLMQDKDNFLLAESIFIGNSIFAAHYPEEFGGLTVLLSPVYSAYIEPPAITYTAVGGSALIGAYNAVELSSESYSKSDIFLRNMLMLNLWYGALYILDEKYHKEEIALDLLPFSDGFAINFQHQF